MSYLVLARKWRPKDFTTVVGQEHVLKALINALDNDRLHHAFLFAGMRGVGKTTLARILAKCINCEQGVSSTPCGECSACQEIDQGRFVDLIEVDAASRTRVDDTRELLDNVQYSPSRGRYKVYLIDEVHMLSTHSFNALLKTLEEPPPHVKFLLATTDPQKLPVTVLSRCLQFNLRRLSPALIRGHLEQLTAAESIEAESAALAALARAADGSMRDALSLLDQAIAYCGGKLGATDINEMLGSVDHGQVRALLHALAGGDGVAMLAVVDDIQARGMDFEAVLGELSSILQQVALAQVIPEGVQERCEDAPTIIELAQLLGAEDVQLYYQIALTGLRDLPLAPDPRAGFEMALLRMLAFVPAATGAGGTAGGAASAAAASAKPRSGSSGGSKTADRASAALRPDLADSTVPDPADSAADTRQTTAQPASAAGAEDGAGAGAQQAASAEAWNGLIDAIGLQGAVRQLAANCLPGQRTGSRLRLTLDEQSAHLLTAQIQNRLQAALSEHYGEDIGLRVEPGTLFAETLAQREAREAGERLQAARVSLEQDPNVRALQDLLGATINSQTIEPL